MRLLRLVLLTAVLAAGLALSAAAQQQNTPIMPLSEVKPGMTGYGLSVFNGTVIDRFDFVVRGIVPDFQINDVEVWPWVITVELSGGPKRADGSVLFDKNMIYSGMSGSPMFIDDRCIGGLMSSQDFNTAAQAAVTPIELQLGLIALKHPESSQPLTESPGAYVGACFVFGDSDRCIESTVTAASDAHLLTTAHSVRIPYGKISLPVFELPVADLQESEKGASKMAGKRGRPLGAAVVHGMFGMVVHEGELPETVPVQLTIDGVFDRPVEQHFNMAYHKTATGALKQVLNTAIARLPIDTNLAGIDVHIRLSEPSGDIHYTDAASAGLSSLEQVLDYLIDQEKEGLRVAGIDVRYRKLPSSDLWAPLAINIEGKKHEGKVTVLARRVKDNAMEQMTAPVDPTSLRPFKKAKTQWMDGTSLQSAILKVMAVRDALPLFAQFENRDALYFVTIENDESIGIDRKAADGVVKRIPKVHILMSHDMGGRRFMATVDAKIKTLSVVK